MLECSSSLRAAGEGASSMEEAATAVVQRLHEGFVDKATGERSLALVRFYKALPYERLEAPLQVAARAAAPDVDDLRGVPCFTLLATAGQEPEWNDRHNSRHPAIPLLSPDSLAHLPLLPALVGSLGLEPDQVVHPDRNLWRSVGQGAASVFFVAEALGNPEVPGQEEFIVPYGIRSVVGVGGVLPSGAMFALLAFSNTPIPKQTAEAFSVLAVSAKVAVLPFVEGRVFVSDQPAPLQTEAALDRSVRIAESRAEALELLLDVRERAVALQTARLHAALEESRRRAEELAASQADLAASEARSAAIISGALDSIVTMGADGRVLEFNPAAEAAFGYTRQEALGRVLAELIVPPEMRERHTQGLERYIATGEGSLINRRVEVDAMRRDGTAFPVELTITPVVGAHPPAFTGYLRDITDRRRAEAELLRGRERLVQVVHTLQASLLPPELPNVAGVELASVYRPAGAGNDVGGDFYDVFELTDSCWALVLGDVCGKGPEAAAITALVRYTLRAAAVRNPSDPAAVLVEVHDAMQRQRPDTFCTAAYAVLRPDDGHVEVVLAGHPSVLKVGPTGEVTPVGGRGPLLGLVDSWGATADKLTLQPGEALVLYSDGVTEARRGGEMFGASRLAGVAGSTWGSAEELVAAIDREVVDFAGELDDDLAILVVRRR